MTEIRRGGGEKRRRGERIKEMEKNEKINHPGWRETHGERKEKLRTEGLSHSLRTQMLQLPETPTLCLTVSELTRFTHTGVCGPGPTCCPSTRHSKTVQRWNPLSLLLEYPRSHTHTHTQLASLSPTVSPFQTHSCAFTSRSV